MWKNTGVYAKGIIMVVGAIITALSPYYGAMKWWPAVTAALTAITAILVPNTPKQGG